MNRMSRGCFRKGAAVLSAILLYPFLAGPALADGKKLEITADKAVVHLDPDDLSPAVETLSRGAVVSLASGVKLKTNWYYVSFPSLRSGNTRSGYILDSQVRKLYPALNVVLVSTEGEIVDPKAINLDRPNLPNLEWGATKASILLTEGKPQSETADGDGVEILGYRRDIMDKKCLVEYVLDRDRLVTTRFHLIENYADKERYIDDYNRIRGFLIAKVGEPRSDRTIWQANTQVERGVRLGEALSKGKVEFSSEWVFRDTSVHIVLAGGDNRVRFGAEIMDVKTRNPISY